MATWSGNTAIPIFTTISSGLSNGNTLLLLWQRMPEELTLSHTGRIQDGR